MEPAIGTRTWYGVRRWGCHYLTRWFRCPPGVEAGLEAGGVSVTPLAPLLVSIHSISSVTGCSGSRALVHLAQRSRKDSLAALNHPLLALAPGLWSRSCYLASRVAAVTWPLESQLSPGLKTIGWWTRNRSGDVLGSVGGAFLKMGWAAWWVLRIGAGRPEVGTG